MKLSVSTFPKTDPKKVQHLASLEMEFDGTKSHYSGLTSELSISGEEPLKVGAVCTEPGRIFSITVLQKDENIFNIAGSLERYAWAMLRLPTDNYLNIHVERNPVALAS